MIIHDLIFIWHFTGYEFIFLYINLGFGVYKITTNVGLEKCRVILHYMLLNTIDRRVCC